MNIEDEPHIAYRRCIGFEVHYAWRTDGVWSTELISADGVIGYYTSLARDRDDVLYAARTESGWVTETFDPDAVVSSTIDLAIDATGDIHVADLDDISRLRYAR